MNRKLFLLPAFASLSVWVPGSLATHTFWNIAGNTVAAGDFLGSTNNFDVIFKTDNKLRMRINNSGGTGDGRVEVLTNLKLIPDPNHQGNLIMPLGRWEGLRALGDPPSGDLSLNRGNLFLLAEGNNPANLSLSNGDLIMPHGIWRGRDGFLGDGDLSLILGDLFVEDGDVGIGLKAGDDPFLSASYDVLLRKNQIRIGGLRDPVFPPSNEAVLHIEAVGRYPGIGQEGHHAVFIKSHELSGDQSKSPDGIAIQLRKTPGNSFLNGKNNFLTFYDNLGVPLGGIEPTGPANAPPDGVVLKSGGADFAEYLDKEDPADTFELGEIVGVSGGKVSRVTQDADHILVVSRGAVVLGNAPQQGFEDLVESVAFLGQVPTLVRGDVTPGDYILPSGFEDGTGIAVSREDLQPKDLPFIVGTAWTGMVGDLGGGPALVTVAIGFKAINWGEIIDTEVNDLKRRVRDLEEMIEKITGPVRQPPSWGNQP